MLLWHLPGSGHSNMLYIYISKYICIHTYIYIYLYFHDGDQSAKKYKYIRKDSIQVNIPIYCQLTM